MNQYVKSEDYGKTGFPKLVMGIAWKGNDTKNYIYSLRQNSTNFNSPESRWRPAAATTPDTSRLFSRYAKNDFDVCIPLGGTPHQGWLESSCTGQYVYNGVLTFQRLIGDFIFDDTKAKENGYFVAESGVSFVPFPTFAYEDSGFYGNLGGEWSHVPCCILLRTTLSLLLTVVRCGSFVDNFRPALPSGRDDRVHHP